MELKDMPLQEKEITRLEDKWERKLEVVMRIRVSERVKNGVKDTKFCC